MGNVLIIDDDEMLCKTLSRNVERMGHEATYALSLEDGLKEIASRPSDVVFLDVRLPDGNGLEALPRVRKACSSPEVIIITGEGDPDGAELAIKSGAWAYVEKPLSLEKITLQLVRALQYRRERADLKAPVVLRREGIIGSSAQLQTCLDLLAQTAHSGANVLLTGETGTGKELFARTIHQNSPRVDKKFVVVDCAALSETLAQSTIFGHEVGAFTGAGKARVGLVKEADGGTLFLDEIGELPLAVQKDFLRVLQERRFRSLGSSKETESDFRLVSATNQDLEKMVESTKFRKDLLFRIRSIPIELPPLRDRPQDIKELALHYMVKLCERYGKVTKGFSPEFIDALVTYDWPGNVRELINTMERVLALARGEPTLFPRHLPTRIRVHQARALVGNKQADGEKREEKDHSRGMLSRLQDAREAALSKAENQYLANLMLFAARDIKEACRISGLSRSRLYHLLKKYKINRS